MLSRNLEQTLHRALSLASERRHEYATLEHLLLGLGRRHRRGDRAARLRRRSRQAAQRPDRVPRQGPRRPGDRAAGDPKPTAGFQRVVQRAAIHVQSSGRDEVTGANVLVALFTERESHAVYFLQLQDMTRLDAVNFISHGIAKAPGRSAQRPVHGATGQQPETHRRSRSARKSRAGRNQDALSNYCVNLNKKAMAGQDRPADRPRPARSSAPSRSCAAAPRTTRSMSAIPASARPRSPKAWPSASSRATCRRCWLKSHHLRARHGRAAGRHALSRRLRGAAEGGGQRAGEPARRDPVHRRDPHRDRRGRHLAAARWMRRTC